MLFQAIPSLMVIFFEHSFFDEINNCNALCVYCNGTVLHLKVGCVRYMNNNECVDNMIAHGCAVLFTIKASCDRVLKVGGKKKRLI